MIRFDPERAIDLTSAMPDRRWFGFIGPYPSRPCAECGDEEFYAGDWNLGYRCLDGHVFGTKDEWDWIRGRYVSD